MTHEWHIPRSGESCTKCQRAFAINEWFAAHIHEQAEGFARHDYCMDCIAAAVPNAIGSWRARRPAPSPRKTPALDREALFGFFLTVGEPENLSKRQFRFVLALLLWRQKVLKLVDTVGEGADEVWQLVEPRSGETFAVPRPPLEETEIERLSSQLEGLISGESCDGFGGIAMASVPKAFDSTPPKT